MSGSPSSNTDKRLILVVGGTGAQGIAVIDALLEPSPDGTPSPYAIRVLTRNTEGRRAKELQEKGVELAVGKLKLSLMPLPISFRCDD